MNGQFASGERLCVVCGGSFIPRQGWERKCYTCWRNNYTPADFAEKVRIEYQTKYVEVEVPVCIDNPRLPNVCEWEAMIMRLIKLAHPDRHGGSQESNDVTRWLLEQRRKVNGAA